MENEIGEIFFIIFYYYLKVGDILHTYIIRENEHILFLCFFLFEWFFLIKIKNFNDFFHITFRMIRL